MPDHTLSLDESKCLVVTTNRPTRCLFTFSIPGHNAEGGVYYFEPVPPAREAGYSYRLRQQFMETLRRAAETPNATFGVLVEYGGFARVEVARSEVLAILAT